MTDRPVIVAYGAGVNSTAELILCAQRKQRVDAILFGDTGGEFDRVYKYIPMFSAWLVAHGLPAITVLRHTREDGTIETLEEECLRTKVLPSIAYGSSRRCSGKYKIEPQDKWANHWPLAKATWARRERIIKLIGYDADESHRKDDADAWNNPEFYEAYVAGASITQIAKGFARNDPKDEKKYKAEIRSLQRKVRASVRYEKQYPLIDAGIDRDGCIEIIRGAGLEIPGKSACFFCPSSEVAEILALPKPLQIRALAMESGAADGLTSVRGLGRSFAWADVYDPKQLSLQFVSPARCRTCVDDSEAAG